MRLQILEKSLVRDHGLRDAVLERREIFFVLAQRHSDGVVDDRRYRSMRVRRFESDRTMQSSPRGWPEVLRSFAAAADAP